MSDKNKETLEKANALLAAGNCDDFVLLCAENVNWTILAETPQEFNGREAIRTFMTPKAEDAADLPTFTVDKTIAEDDFVVCTGEMTMNEKGGKTAKYAFCDIYTFKDGQIAEFTTHMNKLGADAGKESSASA